MMVENPVYHFHVLGITARLEGQDQVKALYAQWAETGECVSTPRTSSSRSATP
jgi:hypothetical protein